MTRLMLEGRALARSAIAVLAVGLVVLACLAVWSTTTTTRATAQVRELNQVSDAWGGFLQHVSIIEEATRVYLQSGGDVGSESVNTAIGSGTSDLSWIAQHGGADDVRSTEAAEAAYRTYTETLQESMAAGARGDDATMAEQAQQAELAATSVRTVIGFAIDRVRLTTTAYLEEVDRANQTLALGAKITAGADFALLLLCSAILLGYQRRVERQAARSRAEHDTVVALAAATNQHAVLEVGLEAARKMGANVVDAGVALAVGSTLELFGMGNRTAGDAAGVSVEVADLPAAAASLAADDCRLLAEQDGAELARVLRLGTGKRYLLAPLVVQQDNLGLLILALDSRPPRGLDQAVTTLASEVAFALDKLWISERLRVIVEHSSDLLFLTGVDNSIRFANPAAETAVGRPTSELVGTDLLSLIHPEDGPDVSAATDGTNDRATAVCRLRSGDGEWMQVEMTIGRVHEQGGSIGLVVNSRDTSERHRLEVELRHAQKLESVGRLSAGIAHEINTPVQFVGDNVRFLASSFDDLLRLREANGAVLNATAKPADLEAAVAAVRELENDLDVDFMIEEVPEAIKQTLEGVARVATIVGAMKAFGYTNNEEKTPADLNEAINNTLVVASSEVKYVAVVHTDLAELPPVWCHIGDVNQVVLNLVVNAAHAIAAADRPEPGTITVSTRVDAEQVVIDVADSGTGIPPDVADKVFEAFFTTKDVGTGTGQGLALCRSLVVDRHGGTIDFTTQPGSGTIFTVRLPIAAPDERASAIPDTEKVEVTT